MNDTGKIMVSVFCIVYNHKPFIRKCLESLINQNVNFKYEILVNDDASTDGTTKIIEEYQNEYPELVRAVLHEENLYSKGVSAMNDILMPMAKGEYIAICEGDDFWISSEKLQIQTDFLENNPEFTICGHNAYYADERGNKKGLFSNITADREISTEEVIEKWIFPTASIMFRREAAINSDFPDVKDKPCADYPLAVNMALNGKAYFFAEPMSVYRVNAKSVTGKNNENPEKKIKANQRFINMLNIYDEYTNKQFSFSFDVMRDSLNFENLMLNREIKKAKKLYPDNWKKRRKHYLKQKIKDSFPFIAKVKNKMIKN